MGGSDDPSNLVQLTIEEHADAHRKLWEEYNLLEDFIAWKALSGQISSSEARILAVKSALTGKTQSKEHIEKRSNKGKKYKPCSEERKLKMSNLMKGRTISESNIKALVDANSGSFWITDGINNKKLKRGTPIPIGWVKGRTFNSHSLP